MKQIPRALVLDDDASWQQILGEILLECGLKVDIAATLDAAAQALRAQPHRVAVVDLSLSMSDHNNIDGLHALDLVHQLDPNCGAILLTGYATVEVAVSALTEHGALTFLRKESFQRSQFRDTVRRILANPPLPSTPPANPVNRVFASSPLGQPLPTKHTTEKALVVDDDAGWRSILEELLDDAGYNVRTCSSFGDALGVLRREKFVLAVIDLSLQGSANNWSEQDSNELEPEGYQLLSTIHAESIPTIVVSGMTEPEEIQHIYAQFFISAFIEKHAFDRAAFRRILEETRQTHDAQSELGTLTEREREVLDLLAQGLTNKEIAEKLVITTNTVKRHLKAIFEKLNVHTRSAATAKVTGG